MPFWKKRDKTSIPMEVRELIEQRQKNKENGTIQDIDSELIVDDNQVNRTVLARYLTKYKYNFKEASNGMKALESIVDKNFHIIWIDLKMPVMNGIDAVKYLRAEYPKGFGYKGFIVGVTGFADDESRQNCIKAGMNTVLSKPYVGDNLYRLHHHSFFSSQ